MRSARRRYAPGRGPLAYASCDPASFARDLRILLDAGWSVPALRAFDLFPMTAHVEVVASPHPAGSAPPIVRPGRPGRSDRGAATGRRIGRRPGGRHGLHQGQAHLVGGSVAPGDEAGRQLAELRELLARVGS